MSTQKREFTGVWIPKFIIEDKDLNWTQRGLYAEIACFDLCTKSDLQLAERIGVSDRQVRTHLKKLIEKGYVLKVSFDGRTRKLRAIKDELLLPGRVEENFRADLMKTSGHIYIDRDNNIDNTESSDSVHVEENVRNTNKEPVSFGEKVLGEPDPAAEPDTRKLLYDVLKFYSLPITNHNHIRKWANDLDKLPDGRDYLLNLLRRDLRTQEGPFKPTLNVPYDVISKKLKIQRFYNGGEDVAPRDPRVYGGF